MDLEVRAYSCLLARLHKQGKIVFKVFRMRRFVKSLLLLPLALLSGFAFAQNTGDMFGGLTYSQTTIKNKAPGNVPAFQPSTVSLGVGVIVMPNLALEGYVFDGLTNATNTVAPNTTSTVQIQNGYGFNLRPYIRLGSGWGAYAKIGRQYGAQDVVTNTPTIQRTTHSTYAHTTYGLGVSYNISNRWSLAAEHLKSRNIASETSTASTTGLGLRYLF